MSLNSNGATVDLAGYRNVGHNAPKPYAGGVPSGGGKGMHLSLSPTGDLIIEVHVMVDVGTTQRPTPTVVNIEHIISECVGSEEIRKQVEKFDLRFAVPTNVRVLCTNFPDEMNKMIRFKEHPTREDRTASKTLTCDVPYAMPNGTTEMAGSPLWAIRCGCQRIVPISQNMMTEERRQYCCLSIDSMKPGADGSGAEYRDGGQRTVVISPGSVAWDVVSYVISNGQIPELSRDLNDHIKDGRQVTSEATYTAIQRAFENKLKLVQKDTYDMRKLQVFVETCPGLTPSPGKEQGFVTVEFTIESAMRGGAGEHPCGINACTCGCPAGKCTCGDVSSDEEE